MGRRPPPPRAAEPRRPGDRPAPVGLASVGRRTVAGRSLSVVAAGGATPRRAGRAHDCAGPIPNTAPDGDFSASAIPNAELDMTDVPRRGESWDAVSDFALSYDGYGYWDDLPTLAGRVLQRWTRRRSLPDTLDELRGCLFYEQRRWHHFGEEPTGRSAEYMWAMVDAIGALAAADLPGHPGGPPVPDPRRAIAPEAHVKLVATPRRGVCDRSPRPRPCRPLPAGPGGSCPCPPPKPTSGWCPPSRGRPVRRGSAPLGVLAPGVPGHLLGDPSHHPARPVTARELKPMPSAEPLPKPSWSSSARAAPGRSAPTAPGARGAHGAPLRAERRPNGRAGSSTTGARPPHRDPDGAE